MRVDWQKRALSWLDKESRLKLLRRKKPDLIINKARFYVALDDRILERN